MALDAGWDEEMLKIEIESLQGMDFDIGLAGFDDDGIADPFAGDDKSDVEEDDFDLSDALEKAALCGNRSHCERVHSEPRWL